MALHTFTSDFRLISYIQRSGDDMRRAAAVAGTSQLFKRKPRKSVEEGLQSLAAVGIAEFETEAQILHIV